MSNLTADHMVAVAGDFREILHLLRQYEYNPPATPNSRGTNERYGLDVCDIVHDIEVLLDERVYPLIGKLTVDSKTTEPANA